MCGRVRPIGCLPLRLEVPERPYEATYAVEDLLYAEGTNWSLASSQQRVYEYVVEPRVFQELPDYAMVLVENGVPGRVPQPVEFNPEIVTLPRVDNAVPASIQPGDLTHHLQRLERQPPQR